VHYLFVDLVDVSQTAKVQALAGAHNLHFRRVSVAVVERDDHGVRKVQKLALDAKHAS
jgi:hypothetical protein